MDLPASFISSTSLLFGADRFSVFASALDSPSPVSIRLNPIKCRNGERPAEGAVQVPWCADGWYLPMRPAFTFDPLLHAGLYYVQEASSMFLHHVLRETVKRPVVALDLCAAPGGKTTTARTVLPPGSVLVSNEPVALRAAVLTENVQKWGHADMIVTRNLPREYGQSGLSFDVIVADVPCSGEGMFRKEEDALSQWTPRHMETCAALQRSIVQDVWPALREGGLMIYSTCTYNRQENEDNVAWICEELGAETVALSCPDEWHVQPSVRDDVTAYRFIPGYTRGEGLFMAVLRKHGGKFPSDVVDDGMSASGCRNNGRQRAARRGRRVKAAECADPKTLEQLLQAVTGDVVVKSDGDRWRAIPSAWSELYDRVTAHLHVLHAGVPLGTMKGQRLVPSSAMAQCAAVSGDGLPRVELRWAEAVAFLRHEPIVPTPDMPKGYVIVTYRGHGIGMVKNIGNRANTLLPQEWRIRRTSTPEQPDVIVLPGL